MTRYWKQALVALFLVAQLAAVWAMSRRGTAAEDLGAEAALKTYGFYLRECAPECGIDFVHESPNKIDVSLEHILPIIASMGASVSVVDFDKDGWLDIYVVTSREGGKNRLYKNLGNGRFRDVAEEMGVADLNQEGT